MAVSAKDHELRIELDTKSCQASAGEIAKMESGLAPLRDLVRDFPVKNLYVTVFYYARGKTYHVKTSLVLPGATLFTGERHDVLYSAYEQCVRKLMKKVAAYKETMGGVPNRDKHRQGTHQDVVPSQEPDPQLLALAAAEGDYAAFRRGMDTYDEPLRKRAGRWVQRYPHVDDTIGNGLQLDDVVEEVLLMAFDRFERRPAAVPLSEWLEGLIDPSLKALTSNPEEELENIRLARSYSEMPETD